MRYLTFLLISTIFSVAACTSDQTEEPAIQGSPKEEINDEQASGEKEDEDPEENEDETVWENDEKSSSVPTYIADHTIATEEVLRGIPVQYIDYARENFHIAYQHTSHGTHVSRGVFGLPDYKEGDDQRFGVSLNKQEAGKLTFYDYALQTYAADGETATDLSADETGFIQATRNFLEDPDNAHVNVIMWSWCDIAGHDVSGNYLPGMTSLISEYGEGGSKIGTAEGQRQNAVFFIFMTGHANANNNIGDGKPANQAELINNYCLENEQYCLDYYSIDSHDMEGNYWEDASDDGYSTRYDGNFYKDWQNSHSVGAGYWENKEAPDGDVMYGAHNTQHITANRKAIAFWWILARLAGWDGTPGYYTGIDM
ncbi:hypothetical protein BY457_11156 [Marinilabilia salmonicolor]|jgi:hypothetical protein|uniref:hypothetical protein n=1 Tax=Marinilabilia salmonicolor TaxID=989 RepID=UPI000D04BDCD|nr:hypothetical protein [Marinilabilia salmonicolor]PRY97775.1 hypothetical protein BY457_11156 [Marinilabilia salmonicolor]